MVPEGCLGISSPQAGGLRTTHIARLSTGYVHFKACCRAGHSNMWRMLYAFPKNFMCTGFRASCRLCARMASKRSV